jgi:hypothetical protein
MGMSGPSKPTTLNP